MSTLPIPDIGAFEVRAAIAQYDGGLLRSSGSDLPVRQCLLAVACWAGGEMGFGQFCPPQKKSGPRTAPFHEWKFFE